MKIFTFKDISSEYFLSTLFPVDKKTGEVGYDYEALQVMRFSGDSPLIMDVDGVRHHLQSDSFVYGLVVHPDSKIHVYGIEGSFTFYCLSVDSHYEPSGGDRLLSDQPESESDAYDAFIQAQKTLHQQVYVGDYEDENEDLEPDDILSDYDDDEIPTPYELADDPMADEIEDRLRSREIDPPEPPVKGSDVPPAEPKEVDPPKEA